MEWHVNKGFWSQDWPNWFLFTSCNYLKHMSLTFLKVTGLWFPPPHTHTRATKKKIVRGRQLQECLMIFPQSHLEKFYFLL